MTRCFDANLQNRANEPVEVQRRSGLAVWDFVRSGSEEYKYRLAMMIGGHGKNVPLGRLDEMLVILVSWPGLR